MTGNEVVARRLGLEKGHQLFGTRCPVEIGSMLMQEGLHGKLWLSTCGSCEGNYSKTDPTLVDDDDVSLAEEVEQIRLEEKEPSGGSRENISGSAAEHPPEMQPSTSDDPHSGPSGIKRKKTTM